MLCLLILGFLCFLLAVPFPPSITNLCPKLFSTDRLLIDKGDFWVSTWLSLISIFVSLVTATIANNISNFSFQSSFVINIGNEYLGFKPIVTAFDFDNTVILFRNNLRSRLRLKRKKPKNMYNFSLDISEISSQILNYKIKSIKFIQNDYVLKLNDVRSKIRRNQKSVYLNIYFWIYKSTLASNLLISNLTSPERHVEHIYENINLELEFDVETFNKKYKQKMIVYIDLKKSSIKKHKYEITGYHIKVK